LKGFLPPGQRRKEKNEALYRNFFDLFDVAVKNSSNSGNFATPAHAGQLKVKIPLFY
jgi:hypothetical protein